VPHPSSTTGAARRQASESRRSAILRLMADHVYKSVEITGSSPEGVTQAIERAIAKASETLRQLDWFEVTEVRGQIGDDGSIAHYQVTLKIGFRLED
jgi:dodecin